MWEKTFSFSFWVWIALLNTILSKSINILANFMISFSLHMNDIILCMNNTNSITQSFSDWHLGHFHYLAIMDSTTINMDVQISQKQDMEFFIYIPKNGIAVSYSSSICNTVRSFQTDLHKGWISFHSLQQWMTVALSPHPFQHVLSDLLIITILTRVNGIPEWFCFSLMPGGVG